LTQLSDNIDEIDKFDSFDQLNNLDLQIGVQDLNNHKDAAKIKKLIQRDQKLMQKGN